MDPNYLRALMHGEISNKKGAPAKGKANSRFERDIEKRIDEYVDGLDLEEDHGQGKLQSSAAKRENLKHQLKDALAIPELSQQIQSAIELLVMEGEQYLSKEDNQRLRSEISAAANKLENLNVDEANQADLQTITGISNESMQAMVNMALAKFNKERFHDSLALFSLVTMLNPEYSEYWLRFGIAAQKCENYDLALRGYSATVELDPNNVNARLLAAGCYINQELLHEAKAEIAAVKTIIEKEPVDALWMDLLTALEKSIKVLDQGEKGKDKT